MAFYNCKNCPAREPGCHSWCEDYIEAKKEHEKAKAWLRAEESINSYKAAVVERIRENKRKRRHKEDWK